MEKEDNLVLAVKISWDKDSDKGLSLENLGNSLLALSKLGQTYYINEKKTKTKELPSIKVL